MKYIVVLLLAMITSFPAIAQSSHPSQAAGNPLWITGAVGFGTSDNDATTETRFVLSPQVGYMLNERWGVGLFFGYEQAATEEPSGTGTEKTTTSEVIFGPMARYYGSLGNSFSWYGQFTAGVGSSTSKVEINGTEVASSNTSSAQMILSPGIQYWFSPSWSMNASLGAIGYTSSGDTRSFDFMLDMSQVVFGMNWHL